MQLQAKSSSSFAWKFPPLDHIYASQGPGQCVHNSNQLTVGNYDDAHTINPEPGHVRPQRVLPVVRWTRPTV